ncbi:MAG: MFS transporter [Candidatus Rokubacteria bacterium]|nr:MFS transporter [Candidatus Rokubacteria bacterium]
MTTGSSYPLVWLLLVFAWITNYVIRLGFSAVLPPMMDELHLSYTRAGVLATGFFWAYTIIQIPAGVLGDRFGRRRILLLGLLAGAAASVVTGFAGTFAALLGARLLTGASQGCLFSNDRAIIAAVTPADKIALGQAVSFSGPGLGTTLGLLLGGVLADLMPWRQVFFVFAVPPVVAALLIVRFVPDPPRPLGRGAFGARLRHVVTQPDLWVLGLAGAAAMYAQYVLLTWTPLLFMEVGVREVSRAGLYASLLGLAAVGGLLLGGWAGDRARRQGFGHKVVLAAGLVGVGCAMLTVGLVLGRSRSAPALAIGLLAASCLVWSVWGPSFALLGEVFSGEDLSTAFGLYNTLVVFGAVLGPFLTGWARDWSGSFTVGIHLSAAVATAGAGIALLIRPAFRLAPPGSSPAR